MSESLRRSPTTWLPITGVLVLTAALYWRTLGFAYFLDAFDILAQPIGLDSALNIKRFPHYIRPVWMGAVWLGRAISGADPFGQHLVAVALHVTNTALVYAAARALFGRRDRAVLVALIWTLFGWHAYNVAYAMVVPPLLVGTFLLASLVLFWRGLGERAVVARVLAPLSYAAALLTKETALPFVAILFVTAYVVRRLSLRRTLGALAPFGVVVAIYWIARVLRLGASSVQVMIGGEFFLLTPRTLPDLAPAMVLHYLRQLVFLPYPIPSLPLDWVGATHVTAATALLLVFLWLPRHRDRVSPVDARMLAFGAGWCVLESSTFLLTSHPRLQYDISVGFAFMVAAVAGTALTAWPATKLRASALSIVLVVYIATHAVIGWRIQNRLAGDSPAVLAYYAAEYVRPGDSAPSVRPDPFHAALRAHVAAHLTRHGCLRGETVAPGCHGDLAYDLNDLLLRWQPGRMLRSTAGEPNRP